jgi:hypothetical protein
MPLLTRSVSPDEAVASWPNVSAGAWSLFLAAETTAWPLSNRLGAAVSRLPDSVRAELDRATRLEVQRIMAARAELSVIDRIAESCDVEPVVLKGGAALVDGSPGFDLGDLDLLLPAEQIQRFGDALVEGGFAHHRAIAISYRSEGALPIELHDALEVGYAVQSAADVEHVPLASFRRLRRLTPAAHVLYMIQHSTTKHALRRGHLRDVLLIGSALDSCSTDERLEVERAVLASPMRELYAVTLALARATQSDGARTAAPVTDEFRRVVAGKYATSVWFPQGSPSLLPLFLDQVPHFVASAADARRLVFGYLKTGNPPGSRWHSPALARISAPLAHGLGVAARTPYRLMALSAACAVGSYIRWCYRQKWSSPTSAAR